MLRLLSASLLVALSSASYCGDSAIPFSLEVLPDGQLVLGCARPTCFGWAPAGVPASNNAFFYRINSVDDGFMRNERDTIAPFDNYDARYSKPMTAVCDQSFSASSCRGTNQWVGGIAPLYNVTVAPIVLRCCSLETLLESEDRGLAKMNQGQIVVGGEVISSGLQVGFDYISDIGKVVLSDGTLRYDVWIRRMPCSGDGKFQKSGSNAIQAFHDTNLAVEAPLSALQGPAYENTIVEAPQQQPVQQVQQQVSAPDAYVGAPQPPVQAAPNNYVQPPVQQAAAPQQYYNPVMACSGGGSTCGGQWCFTDDMTVETMDGKTKRMDELKKDDWVLAVSDKQLEYVPVDFWLHRVPAQVAEFNEFEMEDGKTIKLTDKHYIYKGDCSRVGAGPVELRDLPQEAVFADQVHAGDCLYTLNEARDMFEVRVVRAGRVTQTGIYAPMTSSGKIVVNGVLASCYNVMQERTNTHVLFKYFDMLHNVYESIFGADPEEVVETPAGMSLILAMADLVVPKNLAMF